MIMNDKKQIFEFFVAGSIAIFLIVLVRIVFFQIFVISSDSMYPTLQRGDYVLVLKSPLDRIKIASNDIVVFNMDGKSFVKRVVAIEHDNIIITDGTLFVNDQKYSTIIYPFEQQKSYDRHIEKGSIYVLGDNSKDSVDSRDFGTIKNEHVIGKVILIFSPISRLRFTI